MQVQAARDQNDDAALCAALQREGELLIRAGEAQQALTALLEAVALCSPAEPSRQARLWQWAARAQSAAASLSEVQEYLGLGLRLMTEAGDAAGAIDMLEDLAELESRSGNAAGALRHLEANLSLRRELAEPSGLCRTLLAVGKARLRQQPRQLNEARQVLRAAAELAAELGHRPMLAQARGYLAAAHGLLGDLAEADHLLVQSAEAFERLDDLAGLARVRLGQAQVQAARGEVQSALASAGQALELSRRSSASGVEAQALLLLSAQAEAAGDLAAALAHHRAYHALSLHLQRLQTGVRAQQISARVGLEGSRQQAEFHRQRGSLLESRVAERTAQLEATQLEMLELLASAAECRDAPSGLHGSWVGEASARGNSAGLRPKRTAWA